MGGDREQLHLQEGTGRGLRVRTQDRVRSWGIGATFLLGGQAASGTDTTLRHLDGGDGDEAKYVELQVHRIEEEQDCIGESNDKKRRRATGWDGYHARYGDRIQPSTTMAIAIGPSSMATE